jgi:magnesium-transporting ATPase (P-type)
MELPVHISADAAGGKQSPAPTPTPTPTSGSLVAVGKGNALALTTDELHSMCEPQVPIDTVAQQLGVDLDSGLSAAEAARRLAVYGVNELEKKGKMPFMVLFLSQFANLIIIILIVAAIVSIIVGELVEGVAVIVIILITVCLSTATEYSSGNALDALAQLTDPHTHVYRNGELKKTRTPELVPGDVIELSPGDLVPADIRVLHAHSAKVNEMILTGESADVAKKANVPASEANTKLTNINMVYSSTSVVEGRIKGVVLLTGMRTRVGSIATLLSAADADTGKHNDLGTHTRVMRQMSDGNEHEHEVSDDERSESSEDEEKGAIEIKKPAPSTGFFGGVVESVTKYIASFQPKKTPLQEGNLNIYIFYVITIFFKNVVCIFTLRFAPPRHDDDNICPIWSHIGGDYWDFSRFS